MQRLIARAFGKVQSAGYRGKVVPIAKAFGLHGYVQNLPDGRVKVVAEGNYADLERFVSSLMMKNSIIYVIDVEKQLPPATREYEGFAKIVDESETDSRLDATIGHSRTPHS
jgi:acylphosphatase